jgi:hypothetical protein
MRLTTLLVEYIIVWLNQIQSSIDYTPTAVASNKRIYYIECTWEKMAGIMIGISAVEFISFPNVTNVKKYDANHSMTTNQNTLLQ